MDEMVGSNESTEGISEAQAESVAELGNEHILTLVDGAVGEIKEFSEDVSDRRRICSNAAYPLTQRLEAYEDIIDSEVGDTVLLRARNLERSIGMRQLYLKFDGGNPTGTQKDRIAFFQARDALRRGFDGLTTATCGNYGTALSLAANLAGIRCIIHLPETYHTKRIREIEDLGAEVLRIPGDYEDAVAASRKYAEEHEYYDANPGGENTSMQFRAYGEIAYEIYDELRDAPYALGCPVSNGTTLAGIYRGFLSLYRRGRTSRMPRISAGSSFRKNPIINAYLKNLPHCLDLNPTGIHETKINEPLINRHSFDGEAALNSIRQSGGWAFDASDKEMLHCAKLIREREGLSVLPASTAGLIALMKRHEKEPLPNDRYVAILTGRM